MKLCLSLIVLSLIVVQLLDMTEMVLGQAWTAPEMVWKAPRDDGHHPVRSLYYSTSACSLASLGGFNVEAARRWRGLARRGVDVGWGCLVEHHAHTPAQSAIRDHREMLFAQHKIMRTLGLNSCQS